MRETSKGAEAEGSAGEVSDYAVRNNVPLQQASMMVLWA
jgi:hypothetical protein